MTTRVTACVLTFFFAAPPVLRAQQAVAPHGAPPAIESGPLIIVDGVVVTQGCEAVRIGGAVGLRINGVNFGTIPGLNRGDVESVEVLNGASAGRVGNGATEVIAVTTKKPRRYCYDVGPSPSLEAPLAANFFTPDAILARSADLALTEAQRAAIQAELDQSQTNFTGLQARLRVEEELLGKLTKSFAVNETSVLAQVDRVLAAEREIKRAQVALLVRIKNLLTEQQQSKLREFGRNTGPIGRPRL